MQIAKFNCKICSEIFPNIEKYRMHMATEHSITIPKRRPTRNESPPIANAIEEQEEVDPIWVAENTKNFDMTCNVNDCAAVFSSLTNARKHYNKVHNDPNGYVKCCDIKLRTQIDVNDHIAWHINPGCFK